MRELSTFASAINQVYKSNRILFVGLGEVGRSLYDYMIEKDSDVYYYIDTIDTTKGFYPVEEVEFDWLFICIPWSDNFVGAVKEYQRQYPKAKTIIFSSVPIGTSRLCNAAHSPVEGRHPNLADSFANFTRFVGGGTEDYYLLMESFFDKVIYLDTPEQTELLKLTSTTLYGINIEFARYRNEICKKYGLHYEWVKEYDKAYNRLYDEVGEPRFKRYILDPPEGKIGGHCIRENARLLEKQFPMPNLCEMLSHE